MQNTEYFQMMAGYNRWMNENLGAVCAEMPEETRQRETGAPFCSISGILNHLLLADRVWLGRFTGQPFHATSLDQELYGNFDELRLQRKATDEAISNWISSLSDEALRKPLTFTPMSNPTPRTQLLWICVVHMFNHQTHHRGQLTALIEQAGYDCGVTDLFVFSQTL